MSEKDNTVTTEGFPYGLRCSACHRKMPEGETYSERLQGFADDTPVVILTCVPCGLDGKSIDD